MFLRNLRWVWEGEKIRSKAFWIDSPHITIFCPLILKVLKRGGENAERHNNGNDDTGKNVEEKYKYMREKSKKMRKMFVKVIKKIVCWVPVEVHFVWQDGVSSLACYQKRPLWLVWSDACRDELIIMHTTQSKQRQLPEVADMTRTATSTYLSNVDNSNIVWRRKWIILLLAFLSQNNAKKAKWQGKKKEMKRKNL